MAKCHDKNCVSQNVKAQHQQNKKANKIILLAEPGYELGNSGIIVLCVTSIPPRQLNVSIEGKRLTVLT